MWCVFGTPPGSSWRNISISWTEIRIFPTREMVLNICVNLVWVLHWHHRFNAQWISVSFLWWNTHIFIEENHSIEETHFECLCTLSKSCTNCRCRSVDSEFRFHCFVLEPEVSSSSFALTTDLLGIHMEELLPAATLCHWARLSLQRYKKSSMCAWFLKLCSAVVIIMYVQGLILELINISGIFQLHVHLK